MQVNDRRSSPAHASISFGLILLRGCVRFLFLYNFKHLSCHLIIFLFFSSPLFRYLYLFIIYIYIYICVRVYTYIYIYIYVYIFPLYVFFFVSLSFFFSLVLCFYTSLASSVHLNILFRASTGFASFF